ncbi:M1 family metallopeptidase [Mucilaginibacter robiniae]|uniref:M1 family metallopeptidase n=1 Tax=Mucilaginibacter robiniae TaxID=2728022 RepID=A0A7L5E997_9SPHI|nr:M1 family metallopeptidase [Mucilaginibacter robiniae]QJD97453.1 M1 family metallopeptidase [Mucilaginibacter robiniae]
MKLKTIFFGAATAALFSLQSSAQLMVPKEKFTRADTLRGMLTPLRICYDINYYHLDVKFNIDQKFISGSNLFKFTATQNFTKLQFDLFDNLKVEKVLYKGHEVSFTREFNAVFVTFPQTIKKGSHDEFTVYYSGNPTVAKHAPWDGGVIYTTDSLSHAWVATACQGMGASVWWPTKDHQSDEVDSMLISISVPKGLTDVSNGRLRKKTELPDGYTKFDWFVSNPINNYDVAANIADYTHFGDTYAGEKGKLTLDYWVLSYNLEKARKQFNENVPRMLKAFEYWFGPYPWYEDGYKLVETPHLGMEHQSAVAYGNKYHNGYLGRDLSGTGIGLKWDYIIVHESGHEWFGNNITSKDIADMWIHEGFTDYSESLFIETYYGKQVGQEYTYGLRKGIRNTEPIIGPYNVNKEGSGDMYNKGNNLLNTVRSIINNDEKWRQILRGLSKTFYHQTVTTPQIVNYINQQAGMNLTTVFDQYLRYPKIPTLEVKFENGKAYAKWIADVNSFNMPAKVRVKGGEYKLIHPTTTFSTIDLAAANKDNLEIDTFDYYIDVKID